MALFGLFKKKKKFAEDEFTRGMDLGLPKEETPGKELGMGEELEITSKPMFHPTSFEARSSEALSEAHFDLVRKEMEIISAKLDALRASVESIGHRLSNIEKESKERRW